MTIKTPCSVEVTTICSTEDFRVLTRPTVMALSIQVFLQVAFLFCLVTNSITDWEKAFSQLENRVNVRQEVIESLHKIIEQLEKRLEPLEAKGELGEIRVQSAAPNLPAC